MTFSSLVPTYVLWHFWTLLLYWPCGGEPGHLLGIPLPRGLNGGSEQPLSINSPGFALVREATSSLSFLPILHNINSFCVCCGHDMCPEVSNWTQKNRERCPSWVIVSRVEVGPMNVIKMNLLMVWIFRSTNYRNHFLSLSEGFLVDVWSIPSCSRGVQSVGHAFTSYFCALCPH